MITGRRLLSVFSWQAVDHRSLNQTRCARGDGAVLAAAVSGQLPSSTLATSCSKAGNACPKSGRYRRACMSRCAFLALCLLWPSAVCAGQANAQFRVGIRITGKPAPTVAASPDAPAAVAPAVRRRPSFTHIDHSARARACATRYFSSIFSVRAYYVSGDGRLHPCPW